MFIYSKIPSTTYISKSPYQNASIRIKREKHPFYFFSITPEPTDSYYEIVYQRKVIAIESVHCVECNGYNIIDTKWYKDSVKVTYETSLVKDTIEKTYFFNRY
ncbi:hypothetical protein D3C87_84520 [compost metagenome]